MLFVNQARSIKGNKSMQETAHADDFRHDAREYICFKNGFII